MIVLQKTKFPLVLEVTFETQAELNALLTEVGEGCSDLTQELFEALTDAGGELSE